MPCAWFDTVVYPAVSNIINIGRVTDFDTKWIPRTRQLCFLLRHYRFFRLKESAIYFGSAKRDRDLIFFLCSSFSVLSLVPRDYGNIFVNNLGKWLRRERRIFPSQPLPVRPLRSFPYPYTRSSLVSSPRSRLSLSETRAGRSFRFRGWVCDYTKAGRE